MMKNRRRMGNGTVGEAAGARRATGDSPTVASPTVAAVGPLTPGQRWSVMRKREVVGHGRHARPDRREWLVLDLHRGRALEGRVRRLHDCKEGTRFAAL